MYVPSILFFLLKVNKSMGWELFSKLNVLPKNKRRIFFLCLISMRFFRFFLCSTWFNSTSYSMHQSRSACNSFSLILLLLQFGLLRTQNILNKTAIKKIIFQNYMVVWFFARIAKTSTSTNIDAKASFFTKRIFFRSYFMFIIFCASIGIFTYRWYDRI